MGNPSLTMRVNDPRYGSKCGNLAGSIVDRIPQEYNKDIVWPFAGLEGFAMIGRFGDQVIHLPTKRRGKVVMPTSGAIGIFATPVQFPDERIEELPDSELRVCNDDGNLKVSGIRFASNRSIPDKMQLLLKNNGDGTVTVTGQVPGSPTVMLYNLPIQNGEIVLPDEAFFTLHR